MKPGNFLRSLVLAATALTAATTLAACSKSDAETRVDLPPQKCPQIMFVREARSLVKFKPGAGRAETDIQVSATMTGFGGECSYGDDDVEVELNTQIQARRGAALNRDSIRLPYFVAVMGPDGKTVLARRSFTTELEFDDDDSDFTSVTEALVQRIPIRSIAHGEEHKIVLGFELTREQQAFNEQVIANANARRP